MGNRVTITVDAKEHKLFEKKYKVDTGEVLAPLRAEQGVVLRHFFVGAILVFTMRPQIMIAFTTDEAMRSGAYAFVSDDAVIFTRMSGDEELPADHEIAIRFGLVAPLSAFIPALRALADAARVVMGR